MTKTKHTPGHWKIELHDDIFIRSKDGVFICNIPFSYSKAAANAALIAAAPEILELLKELCQLVKESARIYDNPFDGDDKIFEAIKKSQLVINKAESLNE